VIWGSYDPYSEFDPVDVSKADRSALRAAFSRMLAAKDSRLQALVELASVNCVAVDMTDAGIQALNEFLVRELISEPPSRFPSYQWRSVTGDIAIFLGESVIMRRPALRWELNTFTRSEVGYHTPVITGYGPEVPRTFNWAPFPIVSGYVIQCVNAGRPWPIVIQDVTVLHKDSPVDASLFVRAVTAAMDFAPV
jgi:hypothetical protein